jgi:hypothetical protein
MYTYNASGKLSFRSYPTLYIVYQSIVLKYQERDVVYDKKKALRGLLRAVAIKRIMLNSGKWSGGVIVPIYVDTWEGYWNERDLITHAEAISLATSYYDRLLEEANQILASL